jgi:hypothetical protein
MPQSKAQQGRDLDQGEWASFFEELNRRIEHGADLEATLEIVTEEIAGTEAERLPLNSITYEDGDDEIAVGLGGRGRRFPAVLWHFVPEPRHVRVDDRDGELAAISVLTEDGGLHMLRLYPATG